MCSTIQKVSIKGPKRSHHMSTLSILNGEAHMERVRTLHLNTYSEFKNSIGRLNSFLDWEMRTLQMFTNWLTSLIVPTRSFYQNTLIKRQQNPLFYLLRENRRWRNLIKGSVFYHSINHPLHLFQYQQMATILIYSINILLSLQYLTEGGFQTRIYLRGFLELATHFL